MAPCFSHSEALKNFFCIELLENIHGNLKFLILEASITQLLKYNQKTLPQHLSLANCNILMFLQQNQTALLISTNVFWKELLGVKSKEKKLRLINCGHSYLHNDNNELHYCSSASSVDSAGMMDLRNQ